MPARRPGLELPVQRIAERTTRGDELLLGAAGRDLEGEAETGSLGEQAQQVVEHGDPRRNRDLAAAADLDSGRRRTAPWCLRHTRLRV